VSAVCRFESAYPLCHGSGKGASFMSNSSLSRRRRNRPQFSVTNEALCRGLNLWTARATNSFGSGLAEDENSGVCGRHYTDLIQY